MKLNESYVDRIIRAIAGVILLFLGLSGNLTGGLAILADVVGLVLFATGVIGFCPLYTVFKINTLKK